MRKKLEFKTDWDKWVRCDYLPDPDDERDIQTHIRIWNEAKDKSLDDCIANCQISEDIVDRLIMAMAEAQSEQNYAKAEKLVSFIKQMRALAKQKIDEVTHRFMEHIDEFMPEEISGQK